MINTTKQALQINIKWSNLTDMLLVAQNLGETMGFPDCEGSRGCSHITLQSYSSLCPIGY